MIDAHAHLQDPRCLGDVEAILARARAAGVTQVVVCGTRPEDWDAVMDLARRFPEVIPMLGLHPWYVATAPRDWARDLTRRLELSQAGVGECGLDHALPDHDPEAQAEALRVQLQLARRLDRPVALHGRKAWGALVGLLAREGLPTRGGLVHAFSGSPEVARACVALGLHLSFGGGATRPGRAQRALLATPLDRLLLETDSPDQLPRHLPALAAWPHMEPAGLGELAEVLGPRLGLAPPLLHETCARNALALFQPYSQGS